MKRNRPGGVGARGREPYNLRLREPILRGNQKIPHLDHADPRRGSQSGSTIKVLPWRPRNLNVTCIAANAEALCTWLYALGSMHLALCTWLYALGSMRSALCTWLFALGSMHLAPCTWLYALGSLHLALCAWLSALGSMHLAPCTWLYALGSMHSALRTWLHALGSTFLTLRK